MTIALFLLAAPAPGARESSPAVDAYRGREIASLRLEGPGTFDAETIRRGLGLAEAGAALYEQELSRDISRIRLFLARRGYPYSSVTPRVSGRADSRLVDLVLLVDPGPPVTVGSISLDGVPDGLFEGTGTGAIRLRRGAVLTDEALESARSTLLERLRRHGHARAEVSASVEYAESTVVEVTIEADPGPVYYFERFTASGASDDLGELALSSIQIERGQRYDPRSLERARTNLAMLDLFRQIRFQLTDTAPDSLGLLVELRERTHRTLELAGGYWTDDGFSARVMWRHRNLFRRGRGASAEASYTQYRRRGELSAWWPALLGLRLTGTARLGVENLDEEGFEKRAPGIGVTFTYFHSQRTVSSLGYRIERASYAVKTTESGVFNDPKGPVGYYRYRLARDGTDDRIAPSRGTYAWVSLEYGPPGDVTSSAYVLAEGSGTMHVPLPWQAGLAANLRLGAGKPLGESTVLLPDRRFYAGGATSHRGFRRNRLGPLDENGLPFGGEYVMGGFVELRFPLVWKLEGAAFLDWGQVWRNRDDIDMDRIETAAGPALRILTPVGPLRFDFGYRLTDHEPDEPGFVFHFAIGYPM